MIGRRKSWAYLGIVVVSSSMMSAYSAAQDRKESWPPQWHYYLPSSALLAEAGWELVTSSGLSHADGRQAIVTFWKRPARELEDTKTILKPLYYYARCFAYFDRDMVQTGEKCEHARP